MTKKHTEEKHGPKKSHTTPKKSPSTEKHRAPEKHPAPEKHAAPEKHTAPKKPVAAKKSSASEDYPYPEKNLSVEKATTVKKTIPVEITPPAKKTRTRKPKSDIKSIPSMTEEQTQAYLKFSEACKEVYEKVSKGKMDTRVTELKSTPALTAVVRFMVMVHDLLRIYGVMQFNKHVSPLLYKHLDEIQDQTGQKLPLARVLLDGIKATKMELLSGVTVHPLPEFVEPEYRMMAANIPDPVDSDDESSEPQEGSQEDIDESFEPQEGSPGDIDESQNVGPGGPEFDPNVQPESGTPVEPVDDPPPSIDEEAPPEEAEGDEEAPPEETEQ